MHSPDADSNTVDLEFEIEGGAPVLFKDISVYAHSKR